MCRSKMPVINIYLDEELFEFVRKDKSRIIQQALAELKEKQMNSSPRDNPPAPA